MKAVRLVQIGRPLEMQEIPMPAVGERDALIKIRAAGICHSDVHYRAGRSSVGNLPQTLGHEIAGVVETTGSQASRFKPDVQPHCAGKERDARQCRLLHCLTCPAE